MRSFGLQDIPLVWKLQSEESRFDLPETLFSMDVQRDRDGTLRRVTFRGRGWGHGVGMCQVGAFGMARRGAGYREILSHYYTGVVLVKVP